MERTSDSGAVASLMTVSCIYMRVSFSSTFHLLCSRLTGAPRKYNNLIVINKTGVLPVYMTYYEADILIWNNGIFIKYFL